MPKTIGKGSMATLPKALLYKIIHQRFSPAKSHLKNPKIRLKQAKNRALAAQFVFVFLHALCAVGKNFGQAQTLAFLQGFAVNLVKLVIVLGAQQFGQRGAFCQGNLARCAFFFGTRFGVGVGLYTEIEVALP